MANLISDYIEKTLGVAYSCGLILPNFLQSYYPKDKFGLNHAKTYPMFTVEEYGDQASTYFETGQLILNHSICPERFLLPKCAFEGLFQDPQTKILKSWEESSEYENKVYDEMQATSDAIEESGNLAPGYMFSVGVADGAAHYVVTKVNKKTVQYEHRNFWAWYRCNKLDDKGSMDIERLKRITRFGYGTKQWFHTICPIT